MWQDVLTGIIVSGAFGITVYRMVRFFKSPQKKTTGCTVACKGCALGEGIHKTGRVSGKP